MIVGFEQQLYFKKALFFINAFKDAFMKHYLWLMLIIILVEPSPLSIFYWINFFFFKITNFDSNKSDIFLTYAYQVARCLVPTQVRCVAQLCCISAHAQYFVLAQRPYNTSARGHVWPQPHDCLDPHLASIHALLEPMPTSWLCLSLTLMHQHVYAHVFVPMSHASLTMTLHPWLNHDVAYGLVPATAALTKAFHALHVLRGRMPCTHMPLLPTLMLI